MINNPKSAKVNGEIYPINTDFRIALKCEKVAQDDSISDTERALAVIYLLFGDKGLNDRNNWDGLLKVAKKFLSCNNKTSDIKEEKDMDYEQDEKYIKTSFLSDYNIDLSKVSLHWWDFFDLLNGLSESTILSRVRYVRNYDTSKIKDSKELEKILNQKKMVALKNTDKKKKYTPEEMESINAFYDLTGIQREED